MRDFDDSLPLKLLKAREVTMSYFRPVLQQVALTEQQWRVIRALRQYPDSEAKELAKRCAILSPSLTGILSRLEQQELISRRKSTEDQRVVLISLTDKAQQMFAEVAPLVDERYRHLTKQLSASDMKKLDQLLDKILQLKPDQ
jgi:homoprotocatechuate degradation regulator HpaR